MSTDYGQATDYMIKRERTHGFELLCKFLLRPFLLLHGDGEHGDGELGGAVVRHVQVVDQHNVRVLVGTRFRSESNGVTKHIS